MRPAGFESASHLGTRKDTSLWPWRILHSPEILGNIARPLSILLRGLEALWSPWIGISALTLALVLVLALALALTPARSLHRLMTLRTSTTWKKQKIRDRDAEKKVSSLPGWRHEHRQDPGENGRRIEHFIGENEHLY